MGYLKDELYKMNPCPKWNSIWEKFSSYMSRTSRQPLSLERERESVCVCTCMLCVHAHTCMHMHI